MAVARKAKGMSQESLGNAVGASKGHISGMESGKWAGSIDLLIGVGAVLGVGIDALVYGPDNSYRQAMLPGTTLDDRIRALPDGLQEAVVVTLRECELAAKAVPSQFLVSPTGENIGQFMDLLGRLKKGSK